MASYMRGVTPTLLPEDSVTALLMRMLIPTPYQVSTEGGESREPRGDTRPEDELDAVFGETETPLSKGKGAEEALHGKKRAASEDQEGKSKKAIIGRLGPGERCRRRAL